MNKNLTIKDSNNEKRLYNSRINLSIFFIFICFILLLLRYADLQIFNYQSFITQSEKNRVHVQPVAPKRGLIFDRKGLLLADNQPAFSLVITSERVNDLSKTLSDLQILFKIESSNILKFRERLKRRAPYQAVTLKYRLTEDEISRFAVNRYRFPGVEIKAQLVRHYPKGDDLSHVLGYVGRINSDDHADLESIELNKTNYAATDHIGKIGIERFYETILHGEVGSQNVETNAHGRVLRTLGETKPKPGSDLHLYIDSDLQSKINDLMGARRGSVIVMDPSTGGVLAMVSTPTFDPNPFVTGISINDFAKLRDSDDLPLFNRSLQGQYPPGSIIKPIIGLAGLHYGVISASSTVPDPGWYKLPNEDRLYRDWKKGGHGDRVNLHEAIAGSCDVFFYDLAYKLGVDKIHSFSSQFGLGSVSGIDSTHERSGLLPSRQWKYEKKNLPWFPGETLNIGIGQGYMLTTPLQLAVATTTIANRGIYKIPKLVKSSIDIVQGEKEFGMLETKKVDNSSYLFNTVVSQSNWQHIINAMEAVVHDSEIGTASSISHDLKYKIAGKTGTAQVIGIAQDAEYDANAIIERQRDHALFSGFAPIDNPKVVVSVIIENAGGGSRYAAPIARQIFDWVILDESF